MPEKPTEPAWRFRKFGLLVTGRGEADFIPTFLRSLTSGGDCSFRVVRRIEQRSPSTSEKKQLKMTGTGKALPTRDVEQIGLPARNFLTNNADSFAVLLDDLEYGRRNDHQAVFDRYRAALDSVMSEEMRHRVSVHFLVHMLEAYYFADAKAVNDALGLTIEDYQGDVEDIRNPKRNLKEIKQGFDEIADGRRIVAMLDLEHVLENPQTCAALRTLFIWCILARGGKLTDRFQARAGVCCPVAGPQLARLHGHDDPGRPRP